MSNTTTGLGPYNVRGTGFARTLAARRGPVPVHDQDWRQRELKSWESIWTGHRGRIRYSREWNKGYDGPGKGTW